MRVATSNIKHGAEAVGYRADPELFAEACRQLSDVDVLALQEVDQGVPRSRGADLAAIVAEVTGMEVRFEHTMKFVRGWYGNALLARGEIKDVEVVPLGGGRRFNKKVGRLSLGFGFEPRNAIVATAVVDGREISVAATHLSTQAGLKSEQLEKVASSLNHRPGPRILLGDLNLTSARARPHLEANSLQMTCKVPTFPADEPTRQIDHIAVQGLTICSVEARRLLISDHLTLVAEVE